MNTYQVIDIHTGYIVLSYVGSSPRRARQFAHKRDLAYGAIRYSVRTIWA